MEWKSGKPEGPSAGPGEKHVALKDAIDSLLRRYGDDPSKSLILRTLLVALGGRRG